MTCRLIVADHLPVVRAGLRSFFHETDAIIVDEAQTSEQAVVKTLEALPDALLLDVQFPDKSGFEVVEELRKNDYNGRIVFFADDERLACFARAVAVGADSYLLKKTPQIELLRVVLALVSIQKEQAEEQTDLLASFSGELKRVASTMRRARVDSLSPLTEREAQVLRHIGLGLSNKEIASSLKLSLDTVKEHVKNILRKLDVNDRTQAAIWAVRKKMV